MSEERREFTEEEKRVMLVGAWLARFDSIFDTYGVKLEDRPSIFDDFEIALQDFPVDQLGWAFEEWRRIGKHFPTPGDLRELLTKREEAVDQFEAEKSWNHIRWLLHFFSYDPETGMKPLFADKNARLTQRIEENTEKVDYNVAWLLKPKGWDQRTQYAIEQAGGLERIAMLSAGSEFDFCRKAYLNAFMRYSATKGFLAPTRDEAKQLMERLRLDGFVKE